ncbi:MAG: DEAD/DEAH box helicase family protein [Nitrososphaerota archaeon]
MSNPHLRAWINNVLLPKSKRHVASHKKETPKNPKPRKAKRRKVKMILDVYHNKIVTGSPYRPILDQVASYLDPSRFYTDSYKRGRWDGRVRLYSFNRDTRKYEIPSGFLDRILKVAPQHNRQVIVNDHRSYPEVVPCSHLADGTALDQPPFEFQAGIVEIACAKARGVIKIATGGGKTEVAAGCILSILNSIKDSTCVWLTHRQNLAAQTKSRLEKRLGMEIGCVGNGMFDIRRVTILMSQSWAITDSQELRDFVEHATCIVGDEVHHLESNTWQDVFRHSRAPFRFGLSATPDFEDAGLALIGHTGELISALSSRDLIECGALVRPNIWYAECSYPNPLPDQAIAVLRSKKPNMISELYNMLIVNNAYRNDLIRSVAYQFHTEARPVLILVSRVAHGELLANLLNKSGIRTEYMSGSVSANARASMMQDLKSGSLSVLVATISIIGEGVDMPFLDAMINATGTRGGSDPKAVDKPGRAVVQAIGRLLRRWPGKARCDFVDITDTMTSYFKNVSLGRIQSYIAEGYEQFVNPWYKYSESMSNV